ncbi:response regulator transcription factor [Streptomyces sp. 549]|uniref:response regulator transcription factor n=1 Tax=Streptomyces sp. 549 TaxID=3049076 RepID=UPI0024C3E046|nr:response regulator transcription factor [Streptomyces sp. 549]MDK1473208.1 response regulator transcription factor [Streptomyces sp. 549]
MDDERLFRLSLQTILDSAPDVEVAATCDGPGAVDAVLRHRPHVVLLDLRMPCMDGLAVLAELRRCTKLPEVAMLTTFAADADIAAALRAGAAGYLLKDATPQELVDTVRLLASGRTVYSRAVADVVRDGYLRTRPDDARLARLTPREREVLDLLAVGRSNVQIADRLGIAPATVKDRVAGVLAKLEVANRVQAAVVAHGGDTL